MGQDSYDGGIHISGPQHYPVYNQTAFLSLPQAVNLGAMAAPPSGISLRMGRHLKLHIYSLPMPRGERMQTRLILLHHRICYTIQ